MASRRWDLPYEQESGGPCFPDEKQWVPLLKSQSVSARIEESVESELECLPQPCIYTHKSPYECVSLRIVGVSHSPGANGRAGKGFGECEAATCSMKCL